MLIADTDRIDSVIQMPQILKRWRVTQKWFLIMYTRTDASSAGFTISRRHRQ